MAGEVRVQSTAVAPSKRAGNSQLEPSVRRRKLPPTKSPYFPHPSEDEAESGEEGTSPEEDEDESEFEEEQSVEDSSASEEMPSDDGESESDFDSGKRWNSKKRGAGKTAVATSHSAKRQKQKCSQEFVPYRPPSPGDTEYTDETIHPNTLDFLKDLRENNDRNWLRENDLIYRTAKSDFESFVGHVNELMPEKVDPTIPDLPVKDLVFRIHRDIRFSNDRTPYKTYFSVAWSRTGRKGLYAAYYLHIEPNGKSVAGGGLWQPPAAQLALIRETLTGHPERLKSVLKDPVFKEEFLDSEYENVVSAFARKNAEDALKTAPKGYPKDHPEIDLLRLRSFTVGKSISDHEITSPGFAETVLTVFRKMEPLISLLNDVVLPDPALQPEED